MGDCCQAAFSGRRNQGADTFRTSPRILPSLAEPLEAALENEMVRMRCLTASVLAGEQRGTVAARPELDERA